MNLRNLTTGTCVFKDLDVRDSFAGRLIGLIAIRPREAPAAVLLRETTRVHTLLMGFDLDLYFLDAGLRVIGRSLSVRPFRLPRSPRGCRHVLEVPSGADRHAPIRPGDRLGLVAPDP